MKSGKDAIIKNITKTALIKCNQKIVYWLKQCQPKMFNVKFIALENMNSLRCNFGAYISTSTIITAPTL